MHQRESLLLLVDGEAHRAERLARRLAHLGYRIQIAENGATALLRAHELCPEMVVASSELPILDGFLMLEALRKDPRTRQTQVILIMENSGHEELARGWKAGADLCVPRNQGEADLLATLHRALGNSLHQNAREQAQGYVLAS